MKLSVIIPAYNEEATIEEIIAKVQAIVLPGGLSKEIIVVNDGSKDRTAEILNHFSGQPDMIIVHQNNQGKTGALLTGLRNATGDILLIQDADLEYDPAQYPQLLQPILDGHTQVVYGSRFLGRINNMQPINRWANGISNWTINCLFEARMTDINTCYKVFTRWAFEGIEIKGSHFDMDTEMTVKFFKKGLSIQEVPIAYVARPRAAGKKIRWSTAVKMYWQIIKYRFN
jgi:glycosyltransferase involved in cell wall biosynthesis